jgi:MFS transporter, PAT family, solute carrier family 33 (acetyl-CoA transportor), member 1
VWYILWCLLCVYSALISLTPTIFVIMFLTATQDIAVDAWALTLLRPENLAYASTCQSVGLSIGYFATFTILLALQDTSFSNTYVRPWWGGSGPLSSLAQMLRTVGFLYVVATAIILLKKENPRGGRESRRSRGVFDFKDHALPSSMPVRADSKGAADVEAAHDSTQGQHVHPPRSAAQLHQEVLSTYRELFNILKLPAIRALLLVLLSAKTGFSAYDNVSALKLLDLGFPKQTMAMMAVAQGPISLAGSVVAGRWAAKAGPVTPYMCGFLLRFFMSLTGPPLVSYFGRLNGVVTPLAYALVFVTSVVYSFASDCLMFVSAGALFLSISEKDIGGSYLTMLNTTSNLGGMWHKSITLFLVDRLTLRTVCTLPVGSPPTTKCPIVVDGYQVLSLCLVPVAVMVGVFASRSLRRLMSLPASAWRTSHD